MKTNRQIILEIRRKLAQTPVVFVSPTKQQVANKLLTQSKGR